MRISVILLGGLGNQMFQYSLLLALRKRRHIVNLDISLYNFVSMHNGYELERVFGISEKVLCSGSFHGLWIRSVNKFKPKWLCSCEHQLIYDERVLLHPRKYIIGYWQNELYFGDVVNNVRNAFTFKGIDKVNQGIAHKMESSNSVAMHVRRGDYAESNMSLLNYGYYQKAVSSIKSKVELPVYYIFSDDEVAAKEIAENLDIKYTIINHNSGKDSYKDMFLMSRCKHNIIANSSFSWWGAWLNNNKEKIVVAPEVWIERRPEFKPQCKDWILV